MGKIIIKSITIITVKDAMSFIKYNMSLADITFLAVKCVDVRTNERES